MDYKFSRQVQQSELLYTQNEPLQNSNVENDHSIRATELNGLHLNSINQENGSNQNEATVCIIRIVLDE